MDSQKQGKEERSSREGYVWMSYGQLGGSVIVMFLLLVPFIRIAVAMRESKKGGI